MPRKAHCFRSVVEEAEAQDAPAIVQVAPGEFEFATKEFYTYVRQRLAGSRVPFGSTWTTAKAWSSA